jgi:endonuclease III
MNNDWTPKEYNKLEDTDYKMEEYVRVPKDEYDELLKIRAEFYSNKSKYIKNEKQDLKEWLEEEINKTNKTTTQVFRDSLENG